jgi:hypothetical protein
MAPPSRAELRAILEQKLKSDSDLDAFCGDHFPEIRRRHFTDGMDRVRKVTLLIDHADADALQAALRRALPDLPPPRGAPAPHNLPPRRRFVGRTAELARVAEVLRAGGRGTISQASLWGLGGVGKSALALEHAHRARDELRAPAGVWWVAAEGRPLDAMLRLAADVRRHAPWLLAGAPASGSAEETVEALRLALEAQEDASLIVLDNVSEAGFAGLLPGPVRVLATTRDRELALGEDTRLDVLSDEDARALAGDAQGEAEIAARDRVVIGALGGLAVAVEVAGRAVRRWAGG